MSNLNEKNTLQEYSKASEPEFHIIDGYDNDIAIQDPSALKTIEDILKHKEKVKRRLLFLSEELKNRAESHDNSKLKDPEIK